jgi:hypothetical protein
MIPSGSHLNKSVFEYFGRNSVSINNANEKNK